MSPVLLEVCRIFGQCAAEMVAAQLKKQREDQPIQNILGVVTTGSVWKFLLSQTTLLIDRRDYFINELSNILGILVDQLQRVRERTHEFKF